MAITYGFYNSKDGDRKYTSEQISAIFDFLITDGVLETYGGKFFTVPATQGLGVLVKPGWAWFDETWTQSDAEIPLLLDEPDISLSRIDTVVIETNRTELVRQNNVKVVRGVPAVSPIPQPLENTSAIHNHPIAYITVPSGATAIRTQDIEILVGKNPCPFITSVLQATDITELFANWEGQFTEWFENIQQVLSEEVVTNLQLQIDQRVKIVDKATTAEATAGTNDTKWMTPAKTKAVVEKERWELGDIRSTGRDDLDPNKWFMIGSKDYVDNNKLFNVLRTRYGANYTRYAGSSTSSDGVNWNNACAVGQSPSGEIYILTRVNGNSAPTKNSPFIAYRISPAGSITKVTSSVTLGVDAGFNQRAVYVNGSYYSFAYQIQYGSTTTILSTNYYVIKCGSSGIQMYQFSAGYSFGSRTEMPSVFVLDKYVYHIDCGSSNTSSRPTNLYGYYVIKRIDTSLPLNSTSVKVFSLSNAYNLNGRTEYWCCIGGYLYIRSRQTLSNNTVRDLWFEVNLLSDTPALTNANIPTILKENDKSLFTHYGALTALPYYDGKTYIHNHVYGFNYLYTDDPVPTKNVKLHGLLSKALTDPESGTALPALSKFGNLLPPYTYAFNGTNYPGKIMLSMRGVYSADSNTEEYRVVYTENTISASSLGTILFAGFDVILFIETGGNYNNGRFILIKVNSSKAILPVKRAGSTDEYMKIAD